MPTFEYTGPVPSEPIDYVRHGQTVKGRVFGPRFTIVSSGDIVGLRSDHVEGGEHVEADVNPDPALFTEVN